MAERTKILTFRVSDSEYADYLDMAARLGVTGSALLRDLLFNDGAELAERVTRQEKTIQEMSIKLDLVLSALQPLGGKHDNE